MLRAAMGGFRRSGTFGIGGVIVVAAIVAVIATTMGPGQARPKLAMGLIFGAIALFMLILFVLQARDVDRAETGSVPVSAPAHALSDPTTLGEPGLWAALAVEPITPEAVAARQAVWGTVRSSMRLGWVITPLIFLSVVPIYLFDTFAPILIGAPGATREASPPSTARCRRSEARTGLALAPRRERSRRRTRRPRRSPARRPTCRSSTTRATRRCSRLRTTASSP